MSVDKLKKDLDKVLDEALKLITNVNNHTDLENFRVQFLGKKSILNGLMKSLSDLAPEDKAKAGKDLNLV